MRIRIDGGCLGCLVLMAMGLATMCGLIAFATWVVKAVWQ